MRRDLGSWAGNQAEVSKGAGTGQGHKQLLRSVQDAGPVWEAGAGASLGATPGEGPGPEPAASPPRSPPRSASGPCAARRSGD